MDGESADSLQHSFGFDKVFGQQSSQETVFEEVSTMVQSALDGYKVCIFAYGQTGSGKTHTMQGGEAPNTEGIIPRSIVHILKEAKRLEAQGWAYTMTASFLEIYNEEVRDLLMDGPQPRRNRTAQTSCPAATTGGDSGSRLPIGGPDSAAEGGDPEPRP